MLQTDISLLRVQIKPTFRSPSALRSKFDGRFTSSLENCPRLSRLRSTVVMPGLDFSNHNRNVALHAQGVPLPKATSTGTTIVGCIFDGGVVIAADTRATSGPIVADKVCMLGPSTSNKDLRCLRIVKNYITSLLRYGVPAQGQQQTQSSLPP